LNNSRTSFARQYGASQLATLSFHDAGFAAIFPLSGKAAAIGAANRDIRMKHLMKAGCGVALAVLLVGSAASANEYRLSNNQRISCGRGLSPGKLSTATCKSYAYLFNIKTSEYFRCQV